MEAVVERAQGVFLWVYLDRGLTNVDTFSTLSKRLKDLPSDLDTYYLHMLEMIEELYRHETAQILLICLLYSYGRPPLGQPSLFLFNFLHDGPLIVLNSSNKSYPYTSTKGVLPEPKCDRYPLDRCAQKLLTRHAPWKSDPELVCVRVCLESPNLCQSVLPISIRTT